VKKIGKEINHLFREIRNEKIKRGFKNFSYLTIGELIAQGIGFVGFIYLARYLGPEYYGIYVTVGAFVAMFQIFTFTGLRKVVLRECSKDLENADKLLNRTIGLQSLFIFIAILAMLIASLFTNYAITTKLYIAIFSLNLFSSELINYIVIIFQCTERMQYIAIFNIFKMASFVGFLIIFVNLGYGLFPIILLSVSTSILTLLLYIYYSRKIVKYNIFTKIKIDKNIIKQSITFSAIGICATLHNRVDLFMISLLGTSPEVAIYAVAYNLARESEVLKNRLEAAFFPIAVKTFNNGTIRKKIIIKYSLFFAISMICLSLIGFFLAEPAILLLFGKEYTESAIILKVLIFYIVSWFSTLPFLESIYATGNEKVLLFGKGIMASINIPLNIVLYLLYGLIGIAYSTLVVYTAGSIIINFYSYHTLKKQGYIL
jgi:O-antigen/teichoic acid export membrane protein